MGGVAFENRNSRTKLNTLEDTPRLRAYPGMGAVARRLVLLVVCVLLALCPVPTEGTQSPAAKNPKPPNSKTFRGVGTPRIFRPTDDSPCPPSCALPVPVSPQVNC